MSEGHLGWQLVQLHRLVRDACALAIGIEGRLAALSPDFLAAEDGFSLPSGDLRQALDGVFALEDVADQAEAIAETIRTPADTLAVTRDEIEDEAARALAEGSIDPAFVTLAAKMLRPSPGFRALAEAFASDPDLTAQWNELTIRDLLGEFRDTDAARVRRVCVAADVHPDAEWASLDADSIARLVSALCAAADA